MAIKSNTTREIEFLKEKSISSFLMAIEIINKPTLLYRTENFVFNMCNAWELLLKAQIVDQSGEMSIYYKKNKDRTITLQNCIDIIFSDFNNPVKKNLELIQKLRNKATHFITPEYNELYVSFFQANIIYFVEHMKKIFSINLNDRLPANFLTIAANPKVLQDVKVINKIDKHTFNQFLKDKKELLGLEGENNISISFEVNVKAVKKDEDITIRIDPNADVTAQIINRYLDPSNSHPYRQKDIITKVNDHFGRVILNQYSIRAIQHCESVQETRTICRFN